MSMAEAERKVSFSGHMKNERSPWMKEEAGSGWGTLSASEAEERRRRGGDEAGEKRSGPTGAVDPEMRLGAEKTEEIGHRDLQSSEKSMVSRCRGRRKERESAATTVFPEVAAKGGDEGFWQAAASSVSEITRGSCEGRRRL